ncbi:hypothetical protein E2C01_045077 [Portunus trituberculatus]|uniref:Uncharacterized protein n=1 Tax=Portunus trituberculatus TaxID=210409 RepID=A0A5B7G1U8_PORTR|nr:hypothetical protein [Portunus trituberculatus]
MVTPNPASESPSVEGTRNAPSLCCYPIFSVGLPRSQFHFCTLSYFSNSSSGSPKTEVPLAFCLCQLGGPEEVLC